MPLEARLKFMAIVGSNGMNAKGEFLNDIIDEIGLLSVDYAYQRKSNVVRAKCVRTARPLIVYGLAVAVAAAQRQTVDQGKEGMAKRHFRSQGQPRLH
jgi:hypothetical protein